MRGRAQLPAGRAGRASRGKLIARLTFDLDLGEDLAAIEEAARFNPGPSGDGARAVLADRPELTDYEASFWDSFWECNTMRPVGMAVSPIPYDAISHYLDDNGIKGADRVILRRIVRRLDNAFCATIRKRDKAAK